MSARPLICLRRSVTPGRTNNRTRSHSMPSISAARARQAPVSGFQRRTPRRVALDTVRRPPPRSHPDGFAHEVGCRLRFQHPPGLFPAYLPPPIAKCRARKTVAITVLPLTQPTRPPCGHMLSTLPFLFRHCSSSAKDNDRRRAHSTKWEWADAYALSNGRLAVPLRILGRCRSFEVSNR